MLKETLQRADRKVLYNCLNTKMPIPYRIRCIIYEEVYAQVKYYNDLMCATIRRTINDFGYKDRVYGDTIDKCFPDFNRNNFNKFIKINKYNIDTTTNLLLWAPINKKGFKIRCNYIKWLMTGTLPLRGRFFEILRTKFKLNI